VFNDAQVREQCLDSSIEGHRSEVDNLGYVRVDNRDGAFPSAGAERRPDGRVQGAPKVWAATTRPLHGFRREVGYWLLVGSAIGHVAARLRSPLSTPVGMARDTA
jgi:hypothetical protein